MSHVQESKIYIGNVPWKVDDASLRRAFEQFGTIKDCHVILERETNRSRGFGFITYESSQDALSAVREMDQKVLDGRSLIVNIARPREDRRGGGGGGGGQYQ